MHSCWIMRSRPPVYQKRPHDSDKNRINHFGEIPCRGGALLHPVVELSETVVILSETGQLIEKQWYELENRFQNIILDQFIVMPNHIHAIVLIRRVEQSPTPTTIGNILCVYKSITTKLCNKNILEILKL